MPDYEYFPTTIDNPNNPFTSWDEWMAYENANGHVTCQLIDRFYFGSSQVSRSLDEYMWNLAINDIMDLFPWYIKVRRDTKIKAVPIKEVEKLMKVSKNN